jgi:hypothetical protein
MSEDVVLRHAFLMVASGITPSFDFLDLPFYLKCAP